MRKRLIIKIIAWSFVPTLICLLVVGSVTYRVYLQLVEGLTVKDSQSLTLHLLSDHRIFGLFLLLLLALGALVPAAVTAVGALRITRPIAELMAAIERVAAGNFDQTIAVQPGAGWEALIEQFNRMEARLQEMVGALEQSVVEARQAKDAQQESEEQYHSLFDGVPIGLYRTTPSGKIIDANAAGVEMLGYPDKETLLSSNAVELYVAPQDREGWKSLLAQKGTIRDFETQFYRYDGSVAWVNNSAHAICDEQGEVLYYEGSLEDITGRKQAEEILQQQQEHLEELVQERTAELAQATHLAQEARAEAEKNAERAKRANQAKGVFLTNVNHELFTPLTSVLGFAKIIRKRLHEIIFPALDDDKKIQRAVRQTSSNIEIIVSEGERLTTLLQDVLDLADIRTGRVEWQMQKVLLSEVIDRAVAETAKIFEDTPVELVLDIEPTLPTITGDQKRLVQVVVNLLSNAVKFTYEGHLPGASAVTCRARRSGDEILVSVIDAGIGIASQDYEKAFAEFVQVGDTLIDKPKGTGLGLPLCRGIVAHHGGRIWVESELGVGSTFTFALPVTAGGKD